jgi:hypothetical protein
MRYFQLDPPVPLRAGFRTAVTEGPDAQPFYFDCATCDAKEPPIAGCLADDGAEGRLKFEQIGILTDPPRGPRHALYCAACFAKIMLAQSSLAPDSPPDASAPGIKQQHTENRPHMTATIKDGKLIIELPLNDPPTPSATGKTLVVASTHGNLATTAQVKGKPVVIGVNAYIKP